MRVHTRSVDPTETVLSDLTLALLFFVLAMALARMSPMKLTANPFRWYLDVLAFSAQHSFLRYRVILVLCLISFLLLLAAVFTYAAYCMGRYR